MLIGCLPDPFKARRRNRKVCPDDNFANVVLRDSPATVCRRLAPTAAVSSAVEETVEETLSEEGPPPPAMPSHRSTSHPVKREPPSVSGGGQRIVRELLDALGAVWVQCGFRSQCEGVRPQVEGVRSQCEDVHFLV